MFDNFGLSHCELAEIRTVNPELAAHNIALAYIQAAAQVTKLNSEDEANIFKPITMLIILSFMKIRL